MGQQDNTSRASSNDKPRRTSDDLYSFFDDDEDAVVPLDQQEIDEQRASGVWKKQVLAGYKVKGPRDTSTLLAKIPEGKVSCQIGNRHRTVSIQEAMISLVDRMFDAFQNYGYDFNKEAVGSELELSWIRPVLTKESNGTSVFSGRLSTRRWTMVVKGTPQEVLAFILPADKLIGFSLSSSQFKPYLRLVPSSDGLDVRWKVDKTILPQESVTQIFQDLFSALLKNAQGLSRAPQIFDLRKLNGVLLPAPSFNEDEDVHKKYRDAFFEDMRARSSLDKPCGSDPGRVQSPTNGEPRALPPLAPGTWSGQAENNHPSAQQSFPPAQQVQPPYQPGPPHSGNGAAPQSIPARHTYPPEQSGMSQAQPTPSQESRAGSPFQGFQQLQKQVNQMNLARQSGTRFETPNSFAGALSQMIAALDRELEVVAKAGADAFAQKDWARADAAVKFSGRLTEFKTAAQELLDYYRRP